MKARILTISFLLAMLACQPSEKPSKIAESPQVIEDLHTPVMMQIAQMAEPGFSSSVDFSGLIDSYLVDKQGNVKPTTDSAAIDTYLEILDGAMDPITQAPVFELKDSDSVILVVKEKKAWGHILLDKGTLTIVDIQFPAGSSIAKLGHNTEKFRQQLNGSLVTFSENNFELTPWDDQIEAKGDVVIDGISGATTICQASVDMLNHQLSFYHNYLDK